MKLRIRGNSIRIRVSQLELAEICDRGQVKDRIRFQPGNELTYGLEVSDQIQTLRTVFAASDITIQLPKAQVQAWAKPDEVSLMGSQKIDDEHSLTILVEKDFACLVPREGEEQESLFPNPQANRG